MDIKTEQGGLEPRIKTWGCTLTASWTGATTQRLSTGRESDASTSCSDSDPSSRLLKSYYQKHLIFQCGVLGRQGQDQRAAHLLPRRKMKRLGGSSVPTAVNSRLVFSILITLYYAFYLVSLHLFLFSYLFHYSICLSFADGDALGRCWKDLQMKNFCKGFWQKLLWEVWHRSLVYIQASIIKGHNRVGEKSNSGGGAVFQMLASPFYTNYPFVLECTLTRFRHTHTQLG